MTHQTDISNRAWAELTLLAMIWGASFLAIRTALDEIAPLTSVLHRVTWAALFLWLWMFLKGVPFPRNPRIWVACLVMGALNNVIPFSLMAWGQLHIETGLTSIFNSATAIWGVLVAAFFFRDEALGLRKVAGVALGVLGICLAIGLEALRELDLRALAQLAVLAGTISYALASVWARKFMIGLTPVQAAAGMLTGAALVMLPLVVLVEGKPDFNLQSSTWMAIFYYAIVATAVAYLLYYRVLAMAGAGNLMLVTLMIPPVAITLGALVRDETLNANVWSGFALLALGLIVLDGRVFRLRKG